MPATIKESTELLPPEGDINVGRRVFELLSEILEARKSQELPQKWTHWYNLGKNKHWKNKTVQGVALVSANMLHRHRTRTVNMLTDNNPSFEVARLGLPEDYPEDAYQTILRTCDDWWRNREQQHLLDRSVNNGETYGTALEKVVFNPDMNHGDGDVDPQLLDPFYFGIYPPKALENQKAEGNLHFYPISTREARRRWPKEAENIQGDEEILAELGDARSEVADGKSGTKNLLVRLGTAVKELINTAGGSESNTDQTLVVEAWVRDYTEEGGEPKYAGNLRRVTVLNCGQLVVDDRSNPSINPAFLAEDPDTAKQSYLWDRFPFIAAQSGTDTASFYGMSDFEQLEGLQKELNKSLSQFNLSKDRAARTKLINPRNSGVKNEDLTNYPSIINPVNEIVGRAIRYMEPPQDYGDLLKAIQFYREFFLEVAGTFDLAQAQAGGRDVIAHKAIAELIEQASIMTKNKIRSYARLVRERGRMFLALAQQWYTDDRYVNYAEAGEQFAVKVTGKDLAIPARLTVVSGSMLPVSRIQKREEALALHKQGIIDGEELLKSVEWPNWKKVIQRMQAGPIGEVFEKMLAAGVPEDLIEYFQILAEAKPDEVKKAVKEGEIPPFEQVLQAAMSGQEQPDDPKAQAETAKLAAEVDESKAKADKATADAELTREKIVTERMEQIRIGAGVGFDEDKIKIERAKAIADLKNQDGEMRLKKAAAVSTAKGEGGPYKERGLKSNNKES